MNGLLKNLQHTPILFVYFILVFSLLCGGNLHVLGPLSLRHLSSAVLFLAAVLSVKRIHLKNWALPLYIFFIIVFVLCNFANGEYIYPSFGRALYTYHLPCIAVAVGLPAIIKDIEHIKVFTWSLIALYVINSLLSIFQYSNSEWAWAIATIISSQAEEGVETAQMYTESSDNLLGYAVVAGMFGFVVTNGYFLATYLPVVSYRINKKGLANMVIAMVFLFLAGMTIFVTQQRMAFLSLLLFLLYFVWYGMSEKWRLPLIIIVIVVISFYGLSNIEMGRLATDTNNDTRLKIFNDFLDFADKGYWLFGGSEKYLKLYQKAQHNTFLGAWVGGGFFTFITFLVLYFKLLRDNVILVLRHKRKRTQYPYTICYAVASLIFLLYSMTHSVGVHSGSPMFWIVYTMACVSYTLEERKDRINIVKHNFCYYA